MLHSMVGSGSCPKQRWYHNDTPYWQFALVCSSPAEYNIAIANLVPYDILTCAGRGQRLALAGWLLYWMHSRVGERAV